MHDLGAIAYEAYSREAGGVSLATGDALPEWTDVPTDIRAAWRAAAEAVRWHTVQTAIQSEGRP